MNPAQTFDQVLKALEKGKPEIRFNFQKQLLGGVSML